MNRSVPSCSHGKSDEHLREEAVPDVTVTVSLFVYAPF